MVDIRRWKSAQEAERNHPTHSNGFMSKSDAKKRFSDHFDTDLSWFENKSVLAVGGGTGAIHAMDMAKEAVSVDPISIHVAEELSDSAAEVITAAGEELPFSDDSFDAVLSYNVLDHTANPNTVLREISRVLKSKGTFFFAVHTFSIPKILRRPLHLVDEPHPHHFGNREIRSLLLDAGFTIENEKIEPRFKNEKKMSVRRIGAILARIRFYRAVAKVN